MIEMGRYLTKANIADCEALMMDIKDGKKMFVIEIPFDLKDPKSDKVHTLAKRLMFNTDKAGRFSIRAFRALGWKGSSLKELIAAKYSSLTSEVEVTVVHSEYPAGSKQMRAEIGFINVPGQAPADPASEDDINTVSALMEELAKGITSARATKGDGGGGNSSNHEKPKAATAASDDDIPF